jgi:hypothetical protein
VCCFKVNLLHFVRVFYSFVPSGFTSISTVPFRNSLFRIFLVARLWLQLKFILIFNWQTVWDGPWVAHYLKVTKIFATLHIFHILTNVVSFIEIHKSQTISWKNINFRKYNFLYFFYSSSRQYHILNYKPIPSQKN